VWRVPPPASYGSSCHVCFHQERCECGLSTTSRNTVRKAGLDVGRVHIPYCDTHSRSRNKRPVKSKTGSVTAAVVYDCVSDWLSPGSTLPVLQREKAVILAMCPEGDKANKLSCGFVCVPTATAGVLTVCRSPLTTPPALVACCFYQFHCAACVMYDYMYGIEGFRNPPPPRRTLCAPC